MAGWKRAFEQNGEIPESIQEFDVNPNKLADVQYAQQSTTVDSRTTTRGGRNSGVDEKHVSYPLNIGYSFLVNADGSFSQATTSDQQYLVREVNTTGFGPAWVSDERNQVQATDTLNWDTTGAFLGPTGSKTTQTYRLHTSTGHCWDRTITAEAQKLTSVVGGPGCRD